MKTKRIQKKAGIWFICMLLIISIVTGCSNTPASAELTLDFRGRDPDYFSIELWKDRTNAKLIRKDDIVVLPSEPETYVLNVLSEWSIGNRATYAASVEIQK